MTRAGVPASNAAPGTPLGRGAGSREAGRDEFYDHLLHVCLLLLLQESEAAAPELRVRLRPLGFEQVTTAVEGTLDVLAAAGLVQSRLERTADGRRLRIYSVTSDGASWLRSATVDLRRTEIVLGGFLARCGERLLSLS